MCTVGSFYPQSFLCFCAVSSFYYVIISLMVPHNVYQLPNCFALFLIKHFFSYKRSEKNVDPFIALQFCNPLWAVHSRKCVLYLSKKLDPDQNLSWNQFSDGHRCDYGQKSTTRQLPRHTSSPKRRLNDVEFNPEKTLRQ